MLASSGLILAGYSAGSTGKGYSAGYLAGSTGKLLWDPQRDTRRDPLTGCSGGILGGIHWRATLAGYLAGSTGEPLWDTQRDTRRGPLTGCSGGILGGIHWRAALAGYWVGAWCRSIANADSNIKCNNPFLSGGREKKKRRMPRIPSSPPPRVGGQPHHIKEIEVQQVAPQEELGRPSPVPQHCHWPHGTGQRQRLDGDNDQPQKPS